jgi:hypothetical protein
MDNNCEVSPPALSYWVIPGRFLAGCNPYGMGSTDLLLEILNLGIDAFISLQAVGEKGLYGIKEYDDVLKRMAGTLQRKVSFLRRPIPDAAVCSAEEMSEILDTLDSLLVQGRNLYLHCWAGNGRTGLVVGCWLVRHGLDGEDALKKIMSLRENDKVLAEYRSPETAAQFDMVMRWHELDSKHKQ